MMLQAISPVGMRGAMEKEASHLERQHVHNVYEKIAPFFNDKRYKAWPEVQEFLLAQEPGSLVADIGCGNGKYLHINSQAFKIGCDYCLPLAEAAGNRGYEVMVGNGLHLPYRDGCFDAVLSIAVIHHFSTKERRVKAIKEMARILRVGGRMMIYVWAMEQKRRKFVKQDLLIPWNREATRQNILERKMDRIELDYKNHPLINHFSKVHSTMMAKNMTKVPLSVDLICSSAKSGLHSSGLLARSIDSELVLKGRHGSNDHKHKSILHKLHHCCTELRKHAKAYPFGLPKPGYFLKQMGDHLPKYMQNLDTNKVTELFTSALTNRSHQAIIKYLRKGLFPDLGSNLNGPADPRKCSNSDSDHNKGANCQQVPLSENTSYLRYYHIFKQGELTDLIEQCVPELHVLRTFYDHCNWCVIVEKV